MSKFLNTTNRTVAWFKRANDTDTLEMSPPFQRNPVWTHPQKSYLIDSLLNGFPVPEIYMQDFVDDSGNERHVVIDGQQRIRACLEYVEGDFEIKMEESPTWGGMSFDNLSSDEKKRIFAYTFIVRTLPEMSDEDIRGIFQRLNKNVVALNAQELRQATYWGPFITTMQEIANYGYWSTTGIFTPVNTRRMMDIEYVSELSIAVMHGHQNKKETLDLYYSLYEDEFDGRDDLIEIFRRVLFQIESIFPDIKNTRWKKKTDFYSLFLVLASHHDILPLSTENRIAARMVLDMFSERVNEALAGADLDGDQDEVKSYARSVRASSDAGNRRRRHDAIESILSPIFEAQTAANTQPIEPMQDGLFETNPVEDLP